MPKRRMTLDRLYQEIANLSIQDIQVDVEHEGKKLVLTPEVLSMFYPDSAGRLRALLDTSGRVTEASAATVATNAASTSAGVSTVRTMLRQGLPLTANAAGVYLGSTTETAPWAPITPVLVTADGSGLPPATVFVPLSAGKNIDCMIWMNNATISGAGMHEYNFRTDPLAAVGGISATTPVWNGTIIPSPANGTTPGHTYGHRVMTGVVSSAIGIADGANGDWPNNETVLFTGFYRYV